MQQRLKSPILSKNTSKKKYFLPQGEGRLSPSPSQNARAFKLKQIQSYAKMDRPKFTMVRQDVIKKKIDLDIEAQIKSMERLKNNDLFLRYLHNPLTSHSQSNLHKPEISRKKSQPKVHRSHHEAFNQDDEPCETIFEALNKGDKQFKKNDKTSISRQARRRLSLKISNSVSALRLQQKKKPQKELSPIKLQFELSLDHIVAMKDQNYYTQLRRKGKSCNIFSYMKKSFSDLLAADLLEKYFFAFFSSIEKDQKYKSSILRDLSKYSRQFSTGRFRGSEALRLESMKPTEITINLLNLTVDDIISISSGRLTSQKAFDIINEKPLRKHTIFSEKSSSLQSADVTYDENTNQNMMNFFIKNEEKVEVLDYKLLQFNREENEFAHKCEYFHKNMMNNLQTRGKLCKDTIKDSVQHKKFKEMARMDSESFLNFHNQSKITHSSKQIMINMNKQNKDRKQAILLRQLIKSMVIKNKTEAQIDQLLKEPSQKNKWR